MEEEVDLEVEIEIEIVIIGETVVKLYKFL